MMKTLHCLVALCFTCHVYAVNWVNVDLREIYSNGREYGWLGERMSFNCSWSYRARVDIYEVNFIKYVGNSMVKVLNCTFVNGHSSISRLEGWAKERMNCTCTSTWIVLELSKIVCADEDTSYACVVKYNVAHSSPDEAMKYKGLNFKVKPSIDPPKLKVKPPDISKGIRRYTIVKYNCSTIVGHWKTTAKIWWTINVGGEKQILNSSNKHVVDEYTMKDCVESISSVLTLNMTQDLNGMTAECALVNTSDTRKNQYLFAAAWSQPAFVLSPLSASGVTVTKSINGRVYEGDSLVLTCTAHALPKPTVAWIKDGKQFEHIVTKDDEYKLILKSLCLQEHSGEFKCVVKQELGSNRKSNVVTKSVHVKVEPSTKPFANKNICNEHVYSCTYNPCDAPGFHVYVEGMGCLHYSNQTTTREIARSSCSKIGSSLLRIQDGIMDDAIHDIAVFDKDYWLGLTRHTDQTLRWDGETSEAEYTNENAPLVQSIKRTVQDTKCFRKSPVKRKWIPSSCSSKYNYVCQKSPVIKRSTIRLEKRGRTNVYNNESYTQSCTLISRHTSDVWFYCIKAGEPRVRIENLKNNFITLNDDDYFTDDNGKCLKRRKILLKFTPDLKFGDCEITCCTEAGNKHEHCTDDNMILNFNYKASKPEVSIKYKDDGLSYTCHGYTGSMGHHMTLAVYVPKKKLTMWRTKTFFSLPGFVKKNVTYFTDEINGPGVTVRIFSLFSTLRNMIGVKIACFTQYPFDFDADADTVFNSSTGQFDTRSTVFTYSNELQPGRPHLRVYYHEDPDIFYGGQTIRATCKGFVRIPGRITWIFESPDGNAKGVWTMNETWRSDNYTPQKAVASLVNATRDGDRGTVLAVNWSITADESIQNWTINCYTRYSVDQKQADDDWFRNKSAPFKINYLPRRTKIKLLSNDKGSLRLRCDGYVGSKSDLTWHIFAENLMWIFNITSTGEIKGRVPTNVKVIHKSVHDNSTYGRMVSSVISINTRRYMLPENTSVKVGCTTQHKKGWQKQAGGLVSWAEQNHKLTNALGIETAASQDKETSNKLTTWWILSGSLLLMLLAMLAFFVATKKLDDDVFNLTKTNQSPAAGSEEHSKD